MNVGYPDHPLQKIYPSRTEGVKIGAGTFIGASSTILCGTAVGNNCLVSAGAVVTGALPDNILAGGVPAKVIRPLEKEEGRQET
jgi:maltose O-acetyltransferase